jgi:transcriptional regulator with GAF, ATPase, and Fis domain
MRRLVSYPWPGNVRELENVIERAVILAAGATLMIGPDLLPVNVATMASDVQAPEQPATLEVNEREHILTVLGQTGWVVEGPRGAARILGLHPNTLRSRMKKLGIRRTPHEPS